MTQDSETATGRKIGYARVSTIEQDLQLQLDELAKAGVSSDLIFTDKISGAKPERPGLDRCLTELQSGDVLIVWRLDRLGRSMINLVSLVTDLQQRGIGFQSISDGVIDTASASGELVSNVFSALAQFERRLIQERTQAGLKAARARGRKGGRSRVNPDASVVRMANPSTHSWFLGILLKPCPLLDSTRSPTRCVDPYDPTLDVQDAPHLRVIWHQVVCDLA